MTSSESNSSNSNNKNTMVATSITTATNTTAAAVKTPPRHNYANPHTPIASIKRPRSSLQRAASRSSSSSSSLSPFATNSQQRSSSSSRSDATMLLSPTRTSHTATTPTPTTASFAAAASADDYDDATAAAAEQALSPMHAVCPVQRENGEKDGMIVKTTTTARTTSFSQQQQNSDSPTSSTSATTTTTTSWVGRKVDALFSPVLRFLEQSEETTTTANTAAAAAADDEATADLAANTTDTDTNPSSSSNATAESSSPDSMMMMILSEDDDDNDDINIDARCCSSPQDNNNNNIISNTKHDDHHDNASVHSESSLSMQGVGAPEEDSDEFNPWQFIQSLPPYSHVKHLCPPIALPPKAVHAPAVTLVLDLDETLVHCSVDPDQDNADLEFPVDFHGTTYQVHVRLRPHLFTFLEACRGHFEVVLFTASQKIYANELLNRIDPEGKYIQHRLFRESCLAVEGNFLKDLNVLGRDLAQTILVDNSPHAFGYQVDNGIPIESWFDAPDDKELLKLERFLRSCRNVPDVRPILRAKFACQQLVDDAPPFVYN